MLFVILAILPVHLRHAVTRPESHTHFERHFCCPFRVSEQVSLAHVFYYAHEKTSVKKNRHGAVLF